MLLPLQQNNLLEPQDGALVGSSTLTFSPTGALTGEGALTGASTLTFAPTATLGGIFPLTGSSSLTFTVTGAFEAETVEVDQLAGGYAALNAYNSYLQRKRRREEELERLLESLDDPVDREIAEILHEPEEASIAELQAVVRESYSEADLLAAQAYSERVAKAYARAYAKGTYSALKAFEREIERPKEEEEFLILALTVLH